MHVTRYCSFGCYCEMLSKLRIQLSTFFAISSIQDIVRIELPESLDQALNLDLKRGTPLIKAKRVSLLKL